MGNSHQVIPGQPLFSLRHSKVYSVYTHRDQHVCVCVCVCVFAAAACVGRYVSYAESRHAWLIGPSTFSLENLSRLAAGTRQISYRCIITNCSMIAGLHLQPWQCNWLECNFPCCTVATEGMQQLGVHQSPLPGATVLV